MSRVLTTSVNSKGNSDGGYCLTSTPPELGVAPAVQRHVSATVNATRGISLADLISKALSAKRWLDAVMLGQNLSDKLALFDVLLRCRLLVSKGNVSSARTEKKSVRVRDLNGGHPITLDRYADLSCLREVLVVGDYRAVKSLSTNIILDVGANVGLASLYFANKFPNAIIYAIEANPSVYERLIENTKGVPNIRTFNLAVAERNGVADFFVNPDHLGSSMIRRAAHHEKIVVPVVTLTDFCREHGITSAGLLKFDIEGFEDRMFEGLSRDINIEQFVGELHFDLMAKPFSWYAERVLPLNATFHELGPLRSILHAI